MVNCPDPNELGYIIHLEVVWKCPLVENLRSPEASAILANSNETDRVFNLQLVMSSESSEFEQLGSLIHDLGFIKCERSN